MNIIPYIITFNRVIYHYNSKKNVSFLGYFQQYDYGLWGNIKKYRSLQPPFYNLENVKTPVSLHYSMNDWLSNPVVSIQ
jgi:hypothetical protein